MCQNLIMKQKCVALRVSLQELQRTSEGKGRTNAETQFIFTRCHHYKYHLMSLIRSMTSVFAHVTGYIGL